jgi:predicted neutral ceramidase superfamily lipid hydrolase
VWILLAILLIIIGKVLRGFFRKRKIEKNENVKGSNKNIKISIFIIANIVFSVMMLAKVEWHDKNQYIYDLIPLVYPTINLVCLFCWNKTKNINIKRIISIFNIVLSVLIIFLFLGGLLFSAFDDSSKNIIDALVGLILIILPICSINIFKGDNHKIKKINNINN